MKLAQLNPQQKKIGIIALGIIASVVGALFYFLGPTEKHVESMASKQDVDGLVRFVEARADSDYFANSTGKATEAIIDLSEKKYTDAVKKVGDLLVSDSANSNQKMAIVNAFTKQNMIVPELYKVFEKNPNLRTALKENAIGQNPNIFKDKLLVEMNAVLEKSRTDFGDYADKVKAVKIWNVNNDVNEASFANLLVITKINALQKNIKNGDYQNVLEDFKALQNETGSNLLSLNKPFFEFLTNHVTANIEAKKNLIPRQEALKNLNYEKEIDNLNRSIAEIHNRLNSYLYLEYWISGVSNGRLKIFAHDRQQREVEATLARPDRPYKNFTVYRDYFKIVGNNFKEGILGVVNEPILQRVDVTADQNQLESFNASKSSLEKERVSREQEVIKVHAEIDSHQSIIHNGLNAILKKIEKVTAKDIIDFSSDDNKIRQYVISDYKAIESVNNTDMGNLDATSEKFISFEGKRTSGAIKGTDVNLRENPSTNSKVIGILNNNELVHILGQQGDWFKVRRIEPDQRGWVFGKYVQ